jgi:hypothetical protein
MKCFQFNKNNNKLCTKKDCRYWLTINSHNNCCLIAAENDKTMTLKEIGKIFNITRMRICQIEKRAIEKIKEKIMRKN